MAGPQPERLGRLARSPEAEGDPGAVLDEIVAAHEAMGAMIFNPHRYTLEEGGRQSVDAHQLDLKREADPQGLLNPGKMIAWDDPDFAFDRMYAYPGLRGATAEAAE